MLFWDRFIRRVYASLSEGYPPGLWTVGELLEKGHSRGLWDVCKLNDLSLQICLLTCDPNDVLYNGAAGELLGRGLPPQETGATLLKSCPRRLADLLQIASEGAPLRRAIVFEAMACHFGRPLSRFLARLFLEEAAIADARAEIWLWRTLADLSKGDFVESTLKFPAVLYRKLLRHVKPDDVPDIWPDQPPSWVVRATPDERRFLDHCLTRMHGKQRCFLYLSLYGELNVMQLAFVLEAANPDWTEGRVADFLQAAWHRVVECL